MKPILSFVEFINEAKKQKFKYGCVMAYIKMPDQIKEIHKAIDKDDIYTEEGDRSFGLEKEAHVTILYGLHEEVTLKDVKDLLDDFEFCPKIGIKKISAFENEKYDVLKFDIDTKCLRKANKLLTDKLPYTTDFPDYHPHLTLAYLKPGTAKKYIKEFKDLDFAKPIWKIMYSTPDDGTKLVRMLNND